MSDDYPDYQFPEGCPGKSCPQPGATPTDGRVWRIVNHDPPMDADFRTHVELGKAPHGDPCLRCGLSVQPTEEDARHLLELQPRLGKFVAFADLDPQRGVLKQTLKMPHHTWWPDERTPRHDGFRVSR